MKAIKKSVRLVEETINVCKVITMTGEINWSGSINSMAEQYKIMIDENMPKLSSGEEMAFQCIYNGYMPSGNMDQEIRLLSWHLSEGFQYDSQVRDLIGGEEALIDLMDRVKSWSKSQKLAVIYKAREFWTCNNKSN